jgi:hypothetical protein
MGQICANSPSTAWTTPGDARFKANQILGLRTCRESGKLRARVDGMKDEMAFLRYRSEVVQGWPDSQRKTVFLNAIESRVAALLLESRLISSAWLPVEQPN